LTAPLSPARAHARPARLERVLRPLQIAFLIVGLSLLALYAAAQTHAAFGRAHALEEFAIARDALADTSSFGVAQSVATTPTSDLLAEAREPNQSLWGSGRIAAYRESLRLATGPAIGVLKIVAIDLTVPIFEGTSEVALNRGVGHIEATAELTAPGNLGIAGHRDGFFRGLKDVGIGDVIDVQSLAATTRYRVAEILIVAPTDVYVLDPSDEATLTLVTCYPFYFVGDAPQRYIVKAVPVSG